MTKRRSGGTPKTYPYRVLGFQLKAEKFTIEGDTILPKGVTMLAVGTRIEIAGHKGRETVIGLLTERRTSRTQELSMFKVKSIELFENSTVL